MLVSSIIQFFIFLLLPITYWFFFVRKKDSFLNWIGVKKPIINDNKFFIIFTVFIICSFALIGLTSILGVSKGAFATSQFTTFNISTIISIIIYSVIKTGLSEEIFFRGFLLKSISAKFNYKIANSIQAIAFGLVHGAIFLSTGNIELIYVILFAFATGIIGWLFGYINENKANGSIIPSWLIHSTANIISSILSIMIV